MGQMGPVLVSVLFTLNTVTKLNMCQGLRPAPHLDTVLSAPALHACSLSFILVLTVSLSLSLSLSLSIVGCLSLTLSLSLTLTRCTEALVELFLLLVVSPSFETF